MSAKENKNESRYQYHFVILDPKDDVNLLIINTNRIKK